MLSDKTVAALAKVTGLSADDLANGISQEKEVDLEIAVVKTFTDSEWESYEDRLDKDFKKKYDEGKETGEKQMIREMKTKVGLEYEGRKPEDFIEKFKGKVLSDAKLDPDGRVKELEKDLKFIKETTLKEEQDKVSRLTKENSELKIDGKIGQYIKAPDGLTQEDAKIIVMKNLDFSIDSEGKEVVKKNGQILKDKTRNNVSFENAIIDFATERKWRTGTEGRGGKDNPAGKGVGLDDPKKARKMSELNTYFEQKEINPMGEEARGIISEAAKAAKEAKEEFDFAS